MIPQIVEIGGISINSFGLMVALCFFAAIPVLARSFKQNEISTALAERYVFAAGFSGVVGARLWYVFLEQDREPAMEALFSGAGFTFHGGFLTGILVTVIMTRFDKIPLTKFMDSSGPTLAICYGVGRLGCQLAGDGDYGIATTTIWGMSYAEGVIPTLPGVLAFPTPLYESLLSFLILWTLISVESKENWQVPLARCGLYLVLIGAERFVVEFIRVNPTNALGLSQAQYVYLVVMAVGGLFLFIISVSHDCPN